MTDAVWHRLLEDLSDLQPDWVIPYLNNEPLTDPSLPARIGAIRERLGKPEIEVSTNGALLTERLVYALFEQGTTKLLVSVFGHDATSQRNIMGLDYERVQHNLLAALRLRDALGAPTQICVIQIDVPGADKAALDAAGRRWLEAGAQVRRYGFLDRAGNVDQTINGGPQRDFSLTPQGCELNRHRERTYVLTDGTVLFCCHDWQAVRPMGSLIRSSLREIWQGDAYRKLRAQIEGHAPSEPDFLCKRCKLCAVHLVPQRR
jgi:MoaA/NifB/PqqE/SkfB family radical SAM enzyme